MLQLVSLLNCHLAARHSSVTPYTSLPHYLILRLSATSFYVSLASLALSNCSQPLRHHTLVPRPRPPHSQRHTPSRPAAPPAALDLASLFLHLPSCRRRVRPLSAYGPGLAWKARQQRRRERAGVRRGAADGAAFWSCLARVCARCSSIHMPCHWTAQEQVLVLWCCCSWCCCWRRAVCCSATSACCLSYFCKRVTHLFRRPPPLLPLLPLLHLPLLPPLLPRPAHPAPVSC